MSIARAALIGAAALFAATSAASAQDDAPDSDMLTMVLPEAAEIALALSGAPEHLRDGATVYAYAETGFVLAREGTNGFTCLVNRDSFFYGVAQLKPTCWDPAGRDSYVPVALAVGDALAADAPREQIKADIEAGFADGRYKSPTRLGVAYMLAGDVSVDETGAVTEQHFPGHVMVYAVGVTNADIGYDREAGRADPSLPFMYNAGAGGDRLGYLIAAPGHAH